MKKFLLRTILVVGILYTLGCILLYFYQENLIFHPEKLDQSFQFEFEQEFEEKNITASDGKKLSGVLFRISDSKGLIFYLHGNSGSINSCGIVAETFTELNYDVFMLDYRGYGKSDGSITQEEQTHRDVQTAYNEMKKLYPENKILVLGYSIGTGFASKLASINHPKLLILHAPYYNLTDLMHHKYPIVPTFILKYKLKSNEYLKHCKMPVVIFHGDKDHGIYYGSSLKLKKAFKLQDTLITLHGQGHNGIITNEVYQRLIPTIINR